MLVVAMAGEGRRAFADLTNLGGSAAEAPHLTSSIEPLPGPENAAGPCRGTLKGQENAFDSCHSKATPVQEDCPPTTSQLRVCEDSVAECAADLLDMWAASVADGAARVWPLVPKFCSMGRPDLVAALFRVPPVAVPSGAAAAPRAAHTSRRGAAVPADASCGLTSSLASRILCSAHQASERVKPTAAGVLRRIGIVDREQTIVWLTQVCCRSQLQDSTLYLSVLLLDRYCAARVEPVDYKNFQLTAIAILSIALKMAGAVEERSKTPLLQELLFHLGRGQFPVATIFWEEHMVLQRLHYEVASPTAIDFLDAFAAPPDASPPPFAALAGPAAPREEGGAAAGAPSHAATLAAAAPTPVRWLAAFLLQLSLMDANIQYRYPHSILAAGAVKVALQCTMVEPDDGSVAELLFKVTSCSCK